MVADRPYGEFYDFYSVSAENFVSTLVFFTFQRCTLPHQRTTGHFLGTFTTINFLVPSCNERRVCHSTPYSCLFFELTEFMTTHPPASKFLLVRQSPFIQLFDEVSYPEGVVKYIIIIISSSSTLSGLRQVHSLFQSEFYRQCDLVLHPSVSSSDSFS
jgi:hypothetical protein